MSAVRQARADALLDRIAGISHPPAVDDLPYWLDHWTKAEVTRAVEDLVEAGRVRVEGRFGRVEVHVIDADHQKAPA